MNDYPRAKNMSTELIPEKQKGSSVVRPHTPRVSSLTGVGLRTMPIFVFREPLPADVEPIEEPVQRPRRLKRRRFSSSRGSRLTFLNID